jgi:hypothetical protein
MNPAAVYCVQVLYARVGSSIDGSELRSRIRSRGLTIVGYHQLQRSIE